MLSTLFRMLLLIPAVILTISCSPTQNQPQVWQKAAAYVPSQRQPIQVVLGSPDKPIETKAVHAGPRINHNILSHSNPVNTRIEIDLASQTGRLMVSGKVAIETPISSGKPDHLTPRGNFRVSESVCSGKVSSIYNVQMPFWMRLDQTQFGIYGGNLSETMTHAGCVRMPMSIAKVFFENIANGTPVKIN